MGIGLEEYVEAIVCTKHKVLKSEQVCQTVSPEHDYSMASIMPVNGRAIVTEVFLLYFMNVGGFD